MSLTVEDITRVKLDRITLYASAVTFAVVLLCYIIMDSVAASGMGKSVIDAGKNILFIVAVPIFQLARGLFLKSPHIQVGPEELSRNIIAGALVVVLVLVGVNNLIGFLVGVAIGGSYGQLTAAGLKLNEQLFNGVTLQFMSVFVILPLSLIFCTVLGWSAARKGFEPAWKFFLWCYIFFLIVYSVDYFFAVYSNVHDLLGQSKGVYALGRIAIFPIISCLFLLIGYVSRQACVFLSQRFNLAGT